MSSCGCNVFWSIDAAVTGKTGTSASSVRISPCTSRAKTVSSDSEGLTSKPDSWSQSVYSLILSWCLINLIVDVKKYTDMMSRWTVMNKNPQPNHQQTTSKDPKMILKFIILLHFQVKASAPRPVGGAAAGVFDERGAAAGQAAVSVSQRGSRLLVWPGLPADQPAHHNLGGAEEDRLGGAWPVVKQRIEQGRTLEYTGNIKIIGILIS